MEDLHAALAAHLRGWFALIAWIWGVSPIGAVAMVLLPLLLIVANGLLLAIAWEPWRLRRRGRTTRA